jgi:undecaprenyl-diphosphatase
MIPNAEPRRYLSGVIRLDRFLTLQINRSLRWKAVHSFFRTISRVSDGPCWYVLMTACVLCDGLRGLIAALHMGLTALVTLTVYRLIKTTAQRSRPAVAQPGILQGTDPLDEYSFPSGHTMHAVTFTILATAWYPSLSIVLIPFSALVAASRVILGLHYPTDVLLGAGLGVLIAQASLLAGPIL